MYALKPLAVALAFTSSALATPLFGFGAGNGCLTKHSAYQLVKNFIKLTNGDGFNEGLAEHLLIENIVDTSGSVNSIINAGTFKRCIEFTHCLSNTLLTRSPGGTGPLPLTGPTLTNRTEFIAANTAQASTPYEPLQVYWTCDVVTFRFVIPFDPQPVLGITILETIPSPPGSKFPFQIKQVCFCFFNLLMTSFWIPLL